jgi:hypothetical protein
MKGKDTIRRVGLALGLTGFLMVLGCQPTGNSTSPPSTNKPPEKKPDPKQSGQPKPDPG